MYDIYLLSDFAGEFAGTLVEKPMGTGEETRSVGGQGQSPPPLSDLEGGSDHPPPWLFISLVFGFECHDI